MKTLFLGSTGFLGSAVLAELSKDNDITLLSQNSNQPQLPSTKKIVGSLDDSKTLEILSNEGFERLIDCSWFGLPNLNPENNLKNLNMKIGVYKILFSSGLREINSIGSCLEYGSITGVADENTQGKDLNDFAKIKLELLEYVQNFEIPYRWFRPFYLVGRGQHRNSLLSTAVARIGEGEDFEPNNPSACYDYISVLDAGRGISSAIQNVECLGIINVGSGKLHSVNDLVNTVRSYFGKPSKSSEAKDGLIANISKIQEFTSWTPEYSLSEIVSDFVHETVAD